MLYFLSKDFILFQAITAGLFGLIVGSFLNVCIYRIPERLSLMGRSFCPHCKKMIPMTRNIPLLTYVLQLGKTACCGKHIAFQYPAIEFVTGGLAFLTYWQFPSYPLFFTWFLLLVCPLIIVSAIDFKLQIIPDVISIPFIFVGISVQLFLGFPEIGGALLNSALGILVGGGTLLILAEVISRLKKTEAMGGGDIKLIAMLGAFFGWRPLILIFFLSSVLALFYVIGLYCHPKRRSDRVIPFGPFLSMAAIITLLYGKTLTDLYFRASHIEGNFIFP